MSFKHKTFLIVQLELEFTSNAANALECNLKLDRNAVAEQSLLECT